MKTTLTLPAAIFGANDKAGAPGQSGIDVQAVFSRALAHHQQGRLADAETLYRQVLAQEPRHADAWHLLGLVTHQAGHHDLALDLIGGAIGINGNTPVYHSNFAAVLKTVGRSEDALAAYERAAALDRHSADLHFKCGLLCAELKRFAQAEACYRTALGLQQDFAACHAQLGIVLNAQQRPREALDAYDKALALQPYTYDVHYNRAGVLWQLGDRDGALAAFRAALVQKPELTDAHLRIGNILKEQERFDEAEAAYLAVLVQEPRRAEAHCNLGLVFYARERFDEAVESYRRAIAEEPRLFEAYVNLGNVLRDREQYDDAVACYRTALDIEPDNLQTQCNLGAAYIAQERLHEAVALFDAVLARDAGFAEAHHSRAIALCLLGDLRESLAAYDRAIEFKPDYPTARYGAAYPRLLLGDLARGFAGYEARWNGGRKGYPVLHADKPRFTSRDQARPGRTILLHAEQGVGDTIQFSRYAALVADTGAKVLLQAPRHLHRLLSGLRGIDGLCAMDDRPAFDLHAAVMSLPAIFGTTVESIPAQDAYLFAEDGACAQWRTRLGQGGFKIGIAWQGNPKAVAERGRSAPLAALAPLAAIPGVRLISLQKTFGLEQLASLPPGMHVETLGDDFDSGPDAFIDTAGVMANLDLIATVDTSIGHLAGALGLPVWIALQKIPHWVWMLERTDSPWYPSARLFRQDVGGDWSGPFAAMAHDIRHKLIGSDNAG